MPFYYMHDPKTNFLDVDLVLSMKAIHRRCPNLVGCVFSDNDIGVLT